jgi:hypothetical protein
LLGEGEGVADAVGLALEAGDTVLLTVWAGALRANKVAKPTAVTVPSWVARQVRRDSRRSPAARAAPAGSSESARKSWYCWSVGWSW